jgi:hypothetical protein
MKKKLLYLVFILSFVSLNAQNARFRTYYRVSIEDNSKLLMVKNKLQSPLVSYEIEQISVSNNKVDTVFHKTKKVENYSLSESIDKSLFNKYCYTNMKGKIKQVSDELIFYPFTFNENDIQDYLKDKKLLLKIRDGNAITLPFKGYEVGAMTVPVKIYFSSKNKKLKNNFIFDESINLKLSRINGKEYFYKSEKENEGKSFQNYFNYSFFIGFTKTEISNSNTTNEIDENFNVASLSYGFGVGYTVKSIGVNILLGVDTPLSKTADDWNFKNQPWLGLGVGLDL